MRATNPYSAGAGTMPPFLAGRDRDLERFEALLVRLEQGEHGRSVVYSGLRGVGKVHTWVLWFALAHNLLRAMAIVPHLMT